MSLMPPFMPQQMQQPPLVGQMIVAASEIGVGEFNGNRALIVTPTGTQLQIIIPMDDAASRLIGNQLLAKKVVIPGMNDGAARST